ncbi:MAG: pyridoxal-phosphate dependent enzyme [Candidatus Eremiobacteraeota bacterium]|nr:pyridoxal-phosphate dependent enzyme [Candidatus Eremiobacteraeota bacterium]
MDGLTFDDIRAAADRLRGVAEHTPVLRSNELDDIAGNTLFVKCENRQHGGAFKFRGAYNRLSQLSTDERRRGVVAFSSGNHAQGVALAAKLLGIDATIVMPQDAPVAKLEATRRHGAQVVTYDRRRDDREQIARDLCARAQGTLVPPFDDYRVMAGQGTTALELLEDEPDLDAIATPLGGGGLLAGCAVAARHLRPQIRIFGVEPEAGNDWQLSFQHGTRERIGFPDTIADGLQAMSPGELTWPIVHALAEQIVTVSDEEIRSAMADAHELLQMVVEPSGAVALAAALCRKLPLQGARLGIVITGGNVDADTFERIVKSARTSQATGA